MILFELQWLLHGTATAGMMVPVMTMCGGTSARFEVAPLNLLGPVVVISGSFILPGDGGIFADFSEPSRTTCVGPLMSWTPSSPEVVFFLTW